MAKLKQIALGKLARQKSEIQDSNINLSPTTKSSELVDSNLSRTEYAVDLNSNEKNMLRSIIWKNSAEMNGEDWEQKPKSLTETETLTKTDLTENTNYKSLQDYAAEKRGEQKLT